MKFKRYLFIRVVSVYFVIYAQHILAIPKKIKSLLKDKKNITLELQDLNNKNQKIQENLLTAVMSGDLHNVKQSLQHGADVNLKNKIGQLALVEATHHGHIEIALLLLSYGAHVDQQDYLKNNALIASITQQNSLLFTEFMAYKPDVSKESMSKFTALDWTIITNFPEAFFTILKKASPAIIHHQDEEGHTPLILACKTGKNDLFIQALLHAGSNPEIRDNYHATCIDYALRSATPTESIKKLLTSMQRSLSNQDFDRLERIAHRSYKDTEERINLIISARNTMS